MKARRVSIFTYEGDRWCGELFQRRILAVFEDNGVETSFVVQGMAGYTTDLGLTTRSLVDGAGKSTLLKISRITDPSEGYVKLRGRFVSLLEVGTGFHSELTGRENIFLNGAILGMRRSEILAKFDEIVAFAEVGKFLDTPVKRYSSGMFCQHGVVLEQGRLSFLGSAKEAVQHYLKQQAVNEGGVKSHVVDLKDSPRRGSGSSHLLDKAEFYGPDGEPLSCLQIGDPLKVRVHLHLQNPSESFDVGIGFFNIHGQRVFTAHSSFEPNRTHGAEPGGKVLVCDIPSFTLMPGDYGVGIWADINGVKADLVEEAARITVVQSDYYGTGKAPWNGLLVMEQRWHLESASEKSKDSSGCTASVAG